ncbi:decarboxylase [Streptomyces sp. NPDC059477]|uniref:aspartate racemase/maleate isomerase family protein n=1 Tax=Streptomyces sp. NPDC059477 TaxID=3346847 RepID=UPI0036CAE3C2
MTALGFLHPGDAPADDYPRIEQLLGSDIRLDVVRADLTEPAEAGGPGGAGGAAGADSPARLAAIAERLRLTGAEAVVRTGPDPVDLRTARAQSRALALAAGMPASCAPLAFVNAARELGARRVAVASTGPPPEVDRSAAFLREAGLEVTQAITGPPGDLLALARSADTPETQAVLFPDPALQTAAHLQQLEADLDKPVLTASQVTVWEALRLTDRRVNAPGLGALFDREPIVQV